MAWLYKQLGRRRGARNHETARSGLAWIDRQPEVQRAPSRLERESARCRIPPPPEACARAPESDTRSRLPGAAPWGQPSVGNCSPTLSGYPPTVPILRTHPGGEEAEERDGDCRGSSTTELQLPAGCAGSGGPPSHPRPALT